jgi:hypothetical protein
MDQDVYAQRGCSRYCCLGGIVYMGNGGACWYGIACFQYDLVCVLLAVIVFGVSGTALCRFAAL